METVTAGIEVAVQIQRSQPTTTIADYIDMSLDLVIFPEVGGAASRVARDSG